MIPISGWQNLGMIPKPEDLAMEELKNLGDDSTDEIGPHTYESVEADQAAPSGAGALHFEGSWVRQPDGSIRLIKKNQWREQ